MQWIISRILFGENRQWNKDNGQWTACANGQWTGGFDILTGNAQIRYHFIKRRFSVRSRQGLDKNSTKSVQRPFDILIEKDRLR